MKKLITVLAVLSLAHASYSLAQTSNAAEVAKGARDAGISQDRIDPAIAAGEQRARTGGPVIPTPEAATSISTRQERSSPQEPAAKRASVKQEKAVKAAAAKQERAAKSAAAREERAAKVAASAR